MKGPGKMTVTQLVVQARAWPKKRYTFRVPGDQLDILISLCSKHEEMSQADVITFVVKEQGEIPIDPETKKEFIKASRALDPEQIGVRLDENIGKLIAKQAKINKLSQSNTVGYLLYDLFTNKIAW
jgi:hypothetical protein